MPLTVIGENQDPLIFMVNQLNGYTKDTSGTAIQLLTEFPQSLNGVPAVIIDMKTPIIQPLNIPPTKYRWYVPMNIYVWETSLADRFAVEGHVRDRILSLTYPFQQLTSNYVWMYVKDETIAANVTEFGTPLYQTIMTVELIYDLTNPPLATTPP